MSWSGRDMGEHLCCRSSFSAHSFNKRIFGPVYAAPLVTSNGFTADDLKFIASIDNFEVLRLEDPRFPAPEGTLPTLLALKFTAAIL
jgi:hypothetical protein